MLFVDLVDPVGVEQRRCRRTISQRELLANGPRALVQICLKPVVGCAEPLTRNAAVCRVSMLCRSQCIEHDCLHVGHYAEVEHAVEEANAPPALSVRNPAVGPGMVRLHMLDDASGFDHCLIAVNEQGELSEWPAAA